MKIEELEHASKNVVPYYTTQTVIWIPTVIWSDENIDKIYPEINQRFKSILNVLNSKDIHIQAYIDKLKLWCLQFPHNDVVQPTERLTKTYWGRVYWAWLFCTAWLVRNNKTLIKEFADFILNFNLVLPCGECFHNYRDKDIKGVCNIIITQTPMDGVLGLYNSVQLALNQPIITSLTGYS